MGRKEGGIMGDRISAWMFYKGGGLIDRDDNGKPGYSQFRFAKEDEAELLRKRPNIVTQIRNVAGAVVKGKSVDWYNILYKTRIKVKEDGIRRWNIEIQVTDMRTGKMTIYREQIKARTKKDAEDYAHKSKWFKVKSYIVVVDVTIAGG